jgi:DNA polymerase-3 subunit epsilon
MLVAHNASFDMGVLRRTLEYYELTSPDLTYVCTMLASRRLWPGLANHKLDTVADHVGVSFRHHHAAEDAEACGRILLTQMQAAGVDDPISLASALGMRVGCLRQEAREAVYAR